jgi:hypothetical protein
VSLHFWLSWLLAFLTVLAGLSIIACVREFLIWRRGNDQR